MKAFYKMNNNEKARLIADLFPDDLPAMVDTIKATCIHFKNNEEALRRDWASTFSVDFWFEIISDLSEIFSEANSELLKSHRIYFAGMLFDGYRTLVSVYALYKFSETNGCSLSLKKAIQLLFVSLDLGPLNSAQINVETKI